MSEVDTTGTAATNQTAAPEAGQVDAGGTQQTGAQAAPETQVQANTETTAPEGAAATQVPETYEFKAPEGSTLDQDAVTSFSTLAREIGLSQDAAQKIVDYYGAHVSAMVAKQQEAWLTEAKNDPEIGGKNWDETLRNAQAFFGSKHVPAELKPMVEQFGLGNHKTFLKLFANLGRASAEAPHVQVAASAPAAPRLYPKSSMTN